MLPSQAASLPNVTDDVADLLGTELGGRYRLERLIARGSSGSVYAGHDRVMDRKVAIKLLSTGQADPNVLNLREAYPHVTVLAKPYSLRELQRQLEDLDS